MKKQYALIMIVVIMAFVSGGCKPSAYYQSIEGSVPTINVHGQGKITTKPDEATVKFGITSEETLVSKAYISNSRDMNIVIKTVKGMGIKDENIKTSSYTIMPVYPTDERGRRLPGKPLSFRVSQQLTVKIEDISKVGELIDKTIDSGTNVFNGIHFGLSKVEELEKQAKIKAIKDAEEKATLIAKSLRVKVGRVLKVGEPNIQAYPLKNRVSYGALSESSAPQIEPGSMEVIATCNIIYEIIQ